MKLVIISTANSSYSNIEELKSSNYMTKIKGEYPVERIIRIGRNSGIEKIFCIINLYDQKLKHYLSTNNFGIPVKLFVQNNENPLQSLFIMAPFLIKEPFFIVTMDKVFIENEFSEFIAYSRLQEDVDGVLAVTRNLDDKEPLCVAMNDEDIILKFSDIKDGYSWATGGIYYFTPKILNEIRYALDASISGFRKLLHFLVVRGYILKGFSFSKIDNVENVTDYVKPEDLIRGNE